MTIEILNRQFQIGEKERELVKLGWEQEMGKTMFLVVNLSAKRPERSRLTLSAVLSLFQRAWLGLGRRVNAEQPRVDGLSPEASFRLQKMRGMVLGMVK